MKDYLVAPILFAIACVIFLAAAWFEKHFEITVKKTKEVPNDSLVAEAYSECDQCTHNYQRSQYRSYVDEQVKLILENQKVNAQEAERQIRQRLAVWVQNRKLSRAMGS